MKSARRLALLVFALVTLLSGAGCNAPAPDKAKTSSLEVPVTYYRLENGLRVVLSTETSAPLTTVAIYYNIGFRIEPQDRTGFAHLFEHLMFQGSGNLPKGAYDKIVEGNGGINNGSTRFDFTNYFAVMPSHKLETILWAEADRMRGLAINEESLKNQQGVVGNEVKVNVLNRPYGGFPWIDLPMAANTNWYNAHNFYGDIKDIEAATMEDANDFFKKYYSPQNAVLVVVGDFAEANAREWIEEYFADIPSQDPEAIPDISEPRQTEEKFVTKIDKLANKPAVAFGYHMPERGTPEYYAMGLIDQILLQGEDSLLFQEIVKNQGYAGDVTGAINYLGNMFNYNGPMLIAANFIHDEEFDQAEIMKSVDGVIEKLQEQEVSQSDIDRAMVKLRSNFYDSLTRFGGFGRADLLASFALFDDDPGKINHLEESFREVTPALIQETAREYLRKTNRTVIFLGTAGDDADAAKAEGGNG